MIFNIEPKLQVPVLTIDKLEIKIYRLNNLHHRMDGPAVEYPSGSKFWYQNGRPHREDGPAREYASGYKEFWINGIRI